MSRSLLPMKSEKILFGLAWYRKEQWPEFHRVMEDRRSETFEEWLAHATDLEAKMRKEGVDIVRCPLNIGEFELWCLRKKLPKDATSRAKYVIELMRENRPNQHLSTTAQAKSGDGETGGER